jgi:cullin 3
MFFSRVGGSFKEPRANTPLESDRILKNVASAVTLIMRKETESLSFEEIYTWGYNLVIQRYGEELYECMKSAICQHLRDTRGSLDMRSGTEFGDCLAAYWLRFSESIRILSDVFMYMDRNFLVQYKRPCISDLGYQLFQDEILLFADFSKKTVSCLLDEIDRARNGTDVSKLIPALLSVFAVTSSGRGCVDVFTDSFVPCFRERSMAFYARLAAELFLPLNLMIYTKTTQDAIKRETEWLHRADFAAKLLANPSRTVILGCLVDKHCDELLAGGKFELLLNPAHKQDLQAVCELFSSTSRGRHALLCSFRSEVTRRLANIDPKTYIPDLIETLLDLQLLIKEASLGKEFSVELESCAESVFSRSSDVCARLSEYIDEGIKRSEDRFDRALVVFKYIVSKDVFEAYYRFYLGKRLLWSTVIQRSGDLELEMAYSVRLKQECGQAYCTKIDGMLSDIAISHDLMSTWRQGTGNHIESSVKVLSASVWSNLRILPPEICLPRTLSSTAKVFTDFYTSRFTGRKLTWVHSQGTVDVLYRGAGTLLTVSTIQACILDLFNSADMMTYESLCSSLNIGAPDIRRHLLSLYVNSKCKLLIKEFDETMDGSHTNLSPGDIFRVNECFSFHSRHVRVPLVIDQTVMIPELAGVGSDVDTGGGIETVVQEDRKHLIEAAIVRIMKTRRQLSHSDLTMELCRSLGNRFVPSPQMIKDRVENLIEREYVARDNDDVQLYYYVA